MNQDSNPVEPNKLMLRILKQIQEDIRINRDEIRSLGARIDRNSAQIDGLTHGLLELATQQRTTNEYLVDLRDRVRALEARPG